MGDGMGLIAGVGPGVDPGVETGVGLAVGVEVGEGTLGSGVTGTTGTSSPTDAS